MQAKWTNSGKTEVFVDTKAIPIVKKQVQLIAQQESHESRKLWVDVTAALKYHDVNGATTAKFTIEQKQRELVKERQETGAKWENRVRNNSEIIFSLVLWITCVFLLCRSSTRWVNIGIITIR